MNLFLLTNKVPFPPKDGGSIATYNLASGFTSRGHNVTILALNTKKHYSDLDKVQGRLPERLSIIPVDIDTSIKFDKLIKNLLFSKLPYIATRFLSENFNKQIIDLLEKNKFDIIQMEGLYVLPYLKTIRKYSKLSVAYRAHNIEHEIWERTAIEEKNLLKKLYFKILAKRIKKFEKSFINQYDFLVPISPKDAEWFEDNNNKCHTCVVPVGIGLKSAGIKFKDIEHPSLFYIGGLDWIPNQNGLLWFLENCWGQLTAIYPDLKFYVAGRNVPEDYAAKLKSFDIKFLGEIEDSLAFIRSKSIMVVPLFSGSGIRVKIVEGMAMGKAIVTTTISVEGIHATNKENIMIANNAEGFINSIVRLIEDKNYYDRICLNAYNFAISNYDNDRITSNLIEFYTLKLKC